MSEQEKTKILIAIGGDIFYDTTLGNNRYLELSKEGLKKFFDVKDVFFKK